MNIELLKNRSQPPGGWSYWCPKGQMDFPGGFAFDVQVGKIRAYRAANPGLNLPSDLGAVRHALLLHTFLRLRKQQGLEETMKWFSVTDTDDAAILDLVKKKAQNLQTEQPNESAKPAGGNSLLSTVANLSEGARILSDMFGENRSPVSPTTAFSRAGICAPCKKNEPGNWLARLAGALGPFIKEQLEAKKQMSLETPFDDKLTSCKVCDCCLPLLVWTPILTIAERTDPKTLNKYPKHCWKKNELKDLLA